MIQYLYMFLLYILFGLIGVFIVCGLPYHFDVRRDTFVSEKIMHDTKAAVISDLHCQPYGKKQEKIRRIIEAENPDIVIIPGDLFDIERNLENSFDLIRAVQKEGRDICFSCGNHDNYVPEIDELIEKLKQMNVHVLDGSSIVSHGIEIAGVTDMGRKPDRDPKVTETYFNTDHYRIFLSHRPEFTEFYAKVPCDLIISGHCHGGQWRTPFRKIPIYGPRRGFFPKYAQGIHDLNGRKLYISRGLASGNPYIPRLYNNPEIGIIELKKGA